MHRILFVDDDTRILDGMRRTFRQFRAEWDATFAPSGQEALTLMESNPPYDVIVSDMRMPVLDGAELLAEVQRRQPAAVRAILSGQCDREAGLRSVPVAHRFLLKPCNAEELVAAVAPTIEIRQGLSDYAVRRIAGAVLALPCLPQTIPELRRALENPEIPLDELVRIIEQDAGVAAKVLQLVNSAFFNRQQSIDNIPMAVASLGRENLRCSMESAGFSAESNGCPILNGILQTARHSAQVAKGMDLAPEIRGQAVAAALLQNIGELVLACQTLDASVDAGQAGTYLLSLWGIPQSIIAAIREARCAEPCSDGKAGRGTASLTHLAEVLRRANERVRSEATPR